MEVIPANWRSTSEQQIRKSLLDVSHSSSSTRRTRKKKRKRSIATKSSSSTNKQTKWKHSICCHDSLWLTAEADNYNSFAKIINQTRFGTQLTLSDGDGESFCFSLSLPITPTPRLMRRCHRWTNGTEGMETTTKRSNGKKNYFA